MAPDGQRDRRAHAGIGLALEVRQERERRRAQSAVDKCDPGSGALDGIGGLEPGRDAAPTPPPIEEPPGQAGRDCDDAGDDEGEAVIGCDATSLPLGAPRTPYCREAPLCKVLRNSNPGNDWVRPGAYSP
jgi:hypothetical protein